MLNRSILKVHEEIGIFLVVRNDCFETWEMNFSQSLPGQSISPQRKGKQMGKVGSNCKDKDNWGLQA